MKVGGCRTGEFQIQATGKSSKEVKTNKPLVFLQDELEVKVMHNVEVFSH